MTETPVDNLEAANLIYFERKLRIKLAARIEDVPDYPFREELNLLPELFLLLARLQLDQRVGAEHRPQLLGAIVYLVCPTDMLPEDMVGTAGFIDDLVLAAMVTREMLECLPSEVITAAWSAEPDLEASVTAILERAEKMVGSRLLGRIRDWLGVKEAERRQRAGGPAKRGKDLGNRALG